jgi:hypothetical protein
MKITESALRRIVREELSFLTEEPVGSFTTDLEIVVNIDKSRHATDRQTRHDEKITDEQIMETAKKGLDEVKRRMLLDEIDIDDEIVIRDHKSDLNVVGVLDPLGREGRRFEFTVITVMRKENFKPKSGSKVVDTY